MHAGDSADAVHEQLVVHGASMHTELEILVDAGLDPAAALAAEFQDTDPIQWDS